MYVPDETHSVLMDAESGLQLQAGKALDEGLWVQALLAFVVHFANSGVDPSPSLLAVLAKQPGRLDAAKALMVQGKEACRKGVHAINTARGMIPNTSPPDDRGFEVCVLEEDRSDDDVFKQCSA